MKKGFLLLSLIAGFAYITLSSNITGYTVINTTGSDGSAVTGCSGTGVGCHGTAATTMLIDSIALDSAGTGHIVTKYTPGKSYIIRFGGINGVIGSTLPKFGFQLSVVKASSHIDAGTMAPITGTSTFGTGITIMVQTAAMAALSGTGGLGTVYMVGIPWTAPAAGTGDVKIYGVLNAVNNDTLATSADKWNGKNITIQERASSEVPTVTNSAEFNAYPNPVTGNLSLGLNNVSAGTYTVQVFDLTGKAMVSQQVEVTGSTTTTVNMQNCVPGLYHVVIGKDGINKVISVIKQ